MLHTGPDLGPCRPQRSASCPWDPPQEGLPVRQHLTEPPAGTGSSSSTQGEASTSSPAVGQAPALPGAAQKEKNRKLRGIGKGINSLLTKLIPPKGHREPQQQQQPQQLAQQTMQPMHQQLLQQRESLPDPEH